MINELIDNRIKIKDQFQYINRQTVRNIILKDKYSEVIYDILDTPKSLFIMADEKYVATQNDGHKKKMVKQIVVFDSIFGTTRKHLVNKKNFADFENGLMDRVLDYLYYTYYLDKIENIFCYG